MLINITKTEKGSVYLTDKSKYVVRFCNMLIMVHNSPTTLKVFLRNVNNHNYSNLLLVTQLKKKNM